MLSRFTSPIFSNRSIVRDIVVTSIRQASDNSFWTIALTEEGCEMADKVIEIFEMADGIMKSGMSESELETLSAGLEKVKENLWTAIKDNEENMR